LQVSNGFTCQLPCRLLIGDANGPETKLPEFGFAAVRLAGGDQLRYAALSCWQVIPEGGDADGLVASGPRIGMRRTGRLFKPRIRSLAGRTQSAATKLSGGSWTVRSAYHRREA
jgi:hypothetical protein